METSQDRRRIESYLAGQDDAAREIDAWIRRELEISYPILRFEIDDIAQAVHAKLLVSLQKGRFHQRSALKTYVGRIVHHAAIDRIRRRYRESPLPEERAHQIESRADSPYRSLAALEEQELVNQVLLRSPAGCRALWSMIFLEKLSYEEIGRRLSIPQGTVKSRMWNCRRRAVALLERLRRARPADRRQR